MFLCGLSLRALYISIGTNMYACVGLWLNGGSFKKVKNCDCSVLFSSFCTSICWASTVTVSINTFLIRHGWSEVRPIHLHPFICLCCDGNKYVGGINTCIFLNLASEQFVPTGNVFTGEESNFQRPDWILQLCGGESLCFYLRIKKNTECVFTVLQSLRTHFLCFS